MVMLGSIGCRSLLARNHWPTGRLEYSTKLPVFSDSIKELLTGTFEKVKEISAWDGERVRKTGCLPLLFERKNSRRQQKKRYVCVCVCLCM